MSLMFLWTGLTETGTSTERTSSWAAKLTPTQPSLCISGDCEYNSVCMCFTWRMCTACSLMLCLRILQNQWFNSEQCRDSRQHPYLQRASHLWRAGYLCVRCNQQHWNTVRLCGGRHNRYGSASVKKSNNIATNTFSFHCMTLYLQSYQHECGIFFTDACVFFVEKPLPQIATGDVISVIALLLAAGVLMGITITVLVLKIRSRKDDSSYVSTPLLLLFSQHALCPPLTCFLFVFFFCLWSEVTLPPENCPSQ